MLERPSLELLESPAWVQVECDWIRGGLRKLRDVLRAPTPRARHLRMVAVVNQALYSLRDYPVSSRPERYGGAEGGALLHWIVSARLGEETGGSRGLPDVLSGLSPRLAGCRSEDDFVHAYLTALSRVTASASLWDLAADILQNGFPLPIDRFLAEELARSGWHFTRVPFETVTKAQAFADLPEERGGPENLMNHLGRLVGWADAYPSWNFNVDGWDAIRFNGIPEGVVFRESMTLVELEGFPLPIGAGPAYGEARRRILAGESFRIRTGEELTEHVIQPRIFPRRRAEVNPECYLRVDLPPDSDP